MKEKDNSLRREKKEKESFGNNNEDGFFKLLGMCEYIYIYIFIYVYMCVYTCVRAWVILRERVCVMD